MFILNIKTLFYLNLKLTFIILTFLNNIGACSITCYEINVVLDGLKTILCLR